MQKKILLIIFVTGAAVGIFSLGQSSIKSDMFSFRKMVSFCRRLMTEPEVAQMRKNHLKGMRGW